MYEVLSSKLLLPIVVVPIIGSYVAQSVTKNIQMMTTWQCQSWQNPSAWIGSHVMKSQHLQHMIKNWDKICSNRLLAIVFGYAIIAIFQYQCHQWSRSNVWSEPTKAYISHFKWILGYYSSSRKVQFVARRLERWALKLGEVCDCWLWRQGKMYHFRIVRCNFTSCLPSFVAPRTHIWEVLLLVTIEVP